MFDTRNKSNQLRTFPKKCGSPILIVLLAFIFLTIWSWRKWPDLIIDFGRELYVPWQLTQGKVLYQDIAFLNGPFSPYLNALWFKLFGVSFTTLVLCNLSILLLFTLIMFYYISNKCNKLTASFSCIVFLSVFAFGHLMADVGNYNFICPYSHEMTHGIVLASLAIILLCTNINRLGYGSIILAGLCFGLVFLGKGEIFAALAVATVLGFLLFFFAHPLPPGRKITTILIFLLASIIPIAIFLVYFSAKMSASLALHEIAGTWNGLLGSDVANNIFYKVCTGFDKPGQNLFMMLRGIAGISLLICGMVTVDYLSKGAGERKRTIFLMAIPLFLLLGVMIKKPSFPLLLMGAPLPIEILFLGILVTIFCIQNRTEKAVWVGMAPLVVWAVFAFTLMGKIILNTQLGRYGFVLAMPATILLVVVLLWILPEVLRRRYGGGGRFRWWASIFLTADVILLLHVSNLAYSKKDFVVGNGGDAIITFGPQVDSKGYAVAQLLKYIDSYLPPNATLAVLPEGVMINYQSRRLNPSPYINLMPPEMSIYGEGIILDSLKTFPPDFLVLVHKNTKEYGKGYFGRDPSYGKQIMDWIDFNYVPVWHLLDEPLKDGRFGIKMMKWKG